MSQDLIVVDIQEMAAQRVTAPKVAHKSWADHFDETGLGDRLTTVIVENLDWVSTHDD